MAEWQSLLQSIFVGLIFSYLLAKLISIVVSFKDDNLTVTRAAAAEITTTTRDDAPKRDDAVSSVARPFEEDSVVAEHGSVRNDSDGDYDDEDWEGVESTELDEAFSAATAYVAAAAADRLSQKVSSDVQLQLYGLYKIATEGPCSTPQPSPLKMTARAKCIAKNESPKYGKYDVEKIYQTGWEITTASSKLAECQETIVNLGKQLKALASSSEVALFDKVVSTTNSMANPTQKKNLIKRSSLRNQMQAEDEAKAGMHKSVQTEETKSDKDAQRPPILQSETEKSLRSPKSLNSEQHDRSKTTGPLAIVPGKKQVGFGFLRKLLSRRKKGRGKGTKLLAKA